MEEKRSYNRHNSQNLDISCLRCDSSDVAVKLINMSLTGFQIQIHQKLRVGDLIKLEVTHPDDGIPIFLMGEIMWVQRHQAVEGLCNAGVRLKEISPLDKNRLISIIHFCFIARS